MSGMVHSYVVSDNNRFDKRYKRVVDSFISYSNVEEFVVEKFNASVRENYGVCRGGYVFGTEDPFKEVCDLVRRIEVNENSTDISILVNEVMGALEPCNVEEEAMYGLAVCMACSSGRLIEGILEGFSTYKDLSVVRWGIGLVYGWSCLWGVGKIGYVVDSASIIESLLCGKDLVFSTDEVSRDIVEMSRSIRNSSVIVA